MLEPTYDCPDCEYHKTGVSPHDFHDHLTDVHGYTDEEARHIRHIE
jgi:hypothetical protein